MLRRPLTRPLEENRRDLEEKARLLEPEGSTEGNRAQRRNTERLARGRSGGDISACRRACRRSGQS
jgi:hypothetical protein